MAANHTNPARKPAKSHPWKRAPACDPTRRDIPQFEPLKQTAQFDRRNRPK